MLSCLHRRILLSITLCFLFIVSACAAPRLSYGDQQISPGTGVIVPLYSYPGAAWQVLVQAKEAYPSVPVVAIINPSNGPGGFQDPNFVSGIQLLQSAGITVIGYLPTFYGGLPLAEAEQDISTYTQYYHLSGIFLDQMASVSGYESYYSTLTNYAASLGLWLTVGNPGTSVPASYIGTVSNIVIYEDYGLPSTAFLSTLGYSKSDFSILSYGDTGIDPNYISTASSDVSYLYLTDGSLPSPYTALSSYLTALMASLAGTGSSSTITVDSFDLSGNQIPGLFGTVWSNGQLIAAAFTPFTFQAVPGNAYTVTIDSYGAYSFDYWATGWSSPSITVTPTTSSELAAYYQG